MAMDYLLIQASTVPCKCVFSSSAETDTKKHNHISPTLMEALQMLKFWLKKDWLHFTWQWKTLQKDIVHDEDTEDTLSCLVVAEGNLNDAMVQAIDAIASAEGNTLQEHVELFQIWSIASLHHLRSWSFREELACVITSYSSLTYVIFTALYNLISNSLHLLLHTIQASYKIHKSWCQGPSRSNERHQSIHSPYTLWFNSSVSRTCPSLTIHQPIAPTHKIHTHSPPTLPPALPWQQQMYSPNPACNPQTSCTWTNGITSRAHTSLIHCYRFVLIQASAVDVDLWLVGNKNSEKELEPVGECTLMHVGSTASYWPGHENSVTQSK